MMSDGACSLDCQGGSPWEGDMSDVNDRRGPWHAKMVTERAVDR